MFGLSKAEKETARREREALADKQMAIQIHNAMIRESIEEDNIEKVRQGLYLFQHDVYDNVYSAAMDYLLNAFDRKEIKANIMMGFAIEGYDYLEPLGQKYPIGYAVSGLRQHLDDFKTQWNHWSFKQYVIWKNEYKKRLKSQPEEMKLLSQMHYNMSKQLEIVEKRRESELQQNYEKWYETLLLTTKT